MPGSNWKLEFLIFCFMIKGSDISQYTYLQKDITASIESPVDNNFINTIIGESKIKPIKQNFISNKTISFAGKKEARSMVIKPLSATLLFRMIDIEQN